jgi:hypothetical protein
MAPALIFLLELLKEHLTTLDFEKCVLEVQQDVLSCKACFIMNRGMQTTLMENEKIKI